jgi:UPF0716 family protein affecting phage T7 exclusion
METRVPNAKWMGRLAMQLLACLLLTAGGVLLFVPGLGVPFLFLGALVLMAASSRRRFRPTLVAAMGCPGGARRRTG